MLSWSFGRCLKDGIALVVAINKGVKYKVLGENATLKNSSSSTIVVSAPMALLEVGWDQHVWGHRCLQSHLALP